MATIHLPNIVKKWYGRTIPLQIKSKAVVFPAPRLRLAALNPLLEKILVVGVSPRSESECAWSQPPCLGVDEEGNQVVLLGQRLQFLHHLIHCCLCEE